MRSSIFALLFLGACANPDLPPAPEPNRNITVGALGVAGAIVTCGDGIQRGAQGVGVGLILTDCPGNPRPVDIAGDRWGILSLGLGIGLTVAKCPEFTGVVSFGVGLGAAVFPCPGPTVAPRRS